MESVTTVGLDIAKSVFQVHGVDAAGHVAIRRQLKRRYVLAFFQKLPAWVVGIEACATSHHWSRELKALGHTVRQMPPAYVKPYVRPLSGRSFLVIRHAPPTHRAPDLPIDVWSCRTLMLRCREPSTIFCNRIGTSPTFTLSRVLK